MIEAFGSWCKTSCGGVLEMFDLVSGGIKDTALPADRFVAGLAELGLFATSPEGASPVLPAELSSEDEFRRAMLPVIDPWGSGSLLPEALLFLERDPKRRKRLRKRVEHDREEDLEVQAVCTGGGHRPRPPRPGGGRPAPPKPSASVSLLADISRRHIPQLGGRHWKQVPLEGSASGPSLRELAARQDALPASSGDSGSGGVASTASQAVEAGSSSALSRKPRSRSTKSLPPPRRLGEVSEGVLRRSESKDAVAILPKLSCSTKSAPKVPEEVDPATRAAAAKALQKNKQEQRKLYGQKSEPVLPGIGGTLQWHRQAGGSGQSGHRAAAGQGRGRQVDSASGPRGDAGLNFLRRGASHDVFERYHDG